MRLVRGQTLLPFIDIRSCLHIGGHLFLLRHQGKEHILREGKIVTNRGVHNLLDRGSPTKIYHSICQEIETDKNLRSRIIELMLQFGIGIERIVHNSNGTKFQNGIIGNDTGDKIGK